MSPTVPINHYFGQRNQQNKTESPIPLFHANVFKRNACFEHSNFFKVKVERSVCISVKSTHKHSQ